MSAYLVLTLAPYKIKGQTILVAEDVSVYSEAWPTSTSGELRIVLKEMEGPYDESGPALDQWAKNYLHPDLKGIYRAHE